MKKLILCFVLATWPALCAPPPGVSLNGPIAQWVQHWTDTHGMGCCGIESDCRPTAIKPGDSPSGYVAWIGKDQFGPTAPNDWEPIPTTAFSETSRDNPSGTNWACWWVGRVLCASFGLGG